MKTNTKITNFFSALSDETRLRILKSLMNKEKTVNEIYKDLNNLTLSAVSHQLKYLAALELIKFKKKGREKTFHLSDKFCWCIMRDAFRHFR